jgi:hypothetical protein
MDKEIYLQTQQTVLTMASIVKDLPLVDFLNAIEHADALGPAIDPTLWMQGHRKMYAVRDLASSLLTFQSAVTNLLDEIQEENKTWKS